MVVAQSFWQLLKRSMLLAVTTGLAAMLLFATFQSRIISLFTTDPATIHVLHGALWLVLCLALPLNAAVYVLDGFLYATQSFPFVAAMMASGFLLVFSPILALVEWRLHALWGIWAAKVALNVWRLGTASWWLQTRFS